MRSKQYSEYTDKAHVLQCKVNTTKSQVILTKHSVQSNMECVDLECMQLVDFITRFEAVIGDIRLNRDVFSSAYAKYYHERFDWSQFAQWSRPVDDNHVEYDKGCRLPKDIGDLKVMRERERGNKALQDILE